MPGWESEELREKKSDTLQEQLAKDTPVGSNHNLISTSSPTPYSITCLHGLAQCGVKAMP